MDVQLGKIDDGDILLSKREKEKLIQELETTDKLWRQNQAPIRKRWKHVKNYVAGYQYYDGRLGRFVNHLSASAAAQDGNIDEESVIINDMLRIHLMNVQRLSAYDLQPDVVPDGNDPANKRASRLGRIALADHIRKQNPEKIKRRVATIIDKFGTVFGKVTYDNNKGKEISEPEVDAQGNWRWSKQKFARQGEMVWSFVSPENIILPRYTADTDVVDSLEEINVRTTDYVYRQYGVIVEGEDIRSEDLYLISAADLDENKSDLIDRDTGQDSKRVIVKERYYAPCPRFPKGAIFCWGNKTLLRSSTLLDFYEEIPYYDAQEIFDEKDAFGDTLLWHLIPMQDLKNKGVSAMMRHVEMMSQNKILVHEDSNVKEEDITNETSQIVKWGGPTPPAYIKPPDLQQTVFEFTNLMDNYAMVIGAAHDIARKAKPPSGNAIAAMQDLDDTVFAPTLKAIESMYERMCVATLKGFTKFYDSNHLIKMGGGTKPWIIESFRGEMLMGNFHATISLMSGLPSNKYAKLQFLTQQYQAGLLSAEEVRPFMEFGDANRSLQESQAEEEVADAIIQKLSSEETWERVIPHPWDNHPVIIKKLLETMRGEYDEWEIWQKNAFTVQLNYHQSQLMPLMPPPGGQGGPPDPNKAITAPNEMPAGAGSAPSAQSAAQQPPPGSVPPPIAPGFQNT